MNNFVKLLLGTTLYLLEQSDRSTKKVREQASDNLGDLRDFARDKYETASDRFTRASAALRGDDNRVLMHGLSLAAGVGVGIAIGLMVAPASGEETRNAIVDKVQGFGGKVRDRFSEEYKTGTNG